MDGSYHKTRLKSFVLIGLSGHPKNQMLNSLRDKT